MIIVSQDKKSIYNFNNITNVDVVENEVYIIDDIFADEGALIGRYKTEKRAKEVLQEIIKACTCWENFKYGIAEGIGTPKYEMPED